MGYVWERSGRGSKKMSDSVDLIDVEKKKSFVVIFLII
jgi:hypothetical protein